MYCCDAPNSRAICSLTASWKRAIATTLRDRPARTAQVRPGRPPKLPSMPRTRVLIVGAAGRDFHNFNVVYRDRDDVEVVAFTATQIPNIAGRVYPAELAGPLYPEGIPILPERALVEAVREHEVHEVVFAYSDVTHEHVMHVASRALAAGASFRLIAPRETMLRAAKPAVAVCAVRTGAGKSQTTRRVAEVLRQAGKRVA